MEKMVKISVIIPVYNVEKYLKDCLDSVLAQDFKDFEVICVNDGSTDGSDEIVKEYQKRDNRILYYTQCNKGLSAARNLGLYYATGEYIFFLDSDDMIKPGTLKDLYKVAESKNVEIVHFNVELLYENELVKKEHDKGRFYSKKGIYDGIKTGKELFVEMVENNEYVNSAVLQFVRKDFLDKYNIRFYEGIIYEDTIYAALCFMYSSRVCFYDKRYYIYKVRHESIMTSKANAHSLYSRTICFEEILKIYYTIQLDSRTGEALYVYLMKMLSSLKQMESELYIRREIVGGVRLESPRSRLIRACYGNDRGRVQLCLMGLQKLIEMNDEIVLYGAGKIGSMVYNYISKSGYQDKVKGFVVSKKEDNDEKYLNLPVYAISEQQVPQDVLVIVSASLSYQGDMIEQLNKFKYQNYQVIDELLLIGIRHAVE